MNTKTLLSTAVLVAVSALAGCGGGSGGGSAQVGGSKVTGVITALNPGSGTAVGVASGTTMEVNNVTYIVDDSATIDMDDDTNHTETDLAVGQVVSMEVSDNGNGTWSAHVVEFDDEVQGFVLEKNLADVSGALVGTMNVMGQSVTVDANTVFAAGDSTYASLADVQAGLDVVEVSGYSDGAGNIVATRIEMKSPTEDNEVKGIVSNLDTTARTFTLGSGLTVNYAATSDFPPNLADGLYVEAKSGEDSGALVDNGDGTYTLLATSIEVEEDGDFDVDGAEGDSIEQQGLISVGGDGTVLFNGSAVTLSSSAAGNGVTLEGLAALDGKVVTLEGHIENGAFLVDELDDGFNP